MDMTQNLTYKTFFTEYYILDPYDSKLTAQEQTTALVCSVALGIFTGGMLHLFCLIAKGIESLINRFSTESPDSSQDARIQAIRANEPANIKFFRAFPKTNEKFSKDQAINDDDKECLKEVVNWAKAQQNKDDFCDAMTAYFLGNRPESMGLFQPIFTKTDGEFLGYNDEWTQQDFKVLFDAVSLFLNAEEESKKLLDDEQKPKPQDPKPKPAAQQQQVIDAGDIFAQYNLDNADPEDTFKASFADNLERMKKGEMIVGIGLLARRVIMKERDQEKQEKLIEGLNKAFNNSQTINPVINCIHKRTIDEMFTYFTKQDFVTLYMAIGVYLELLDKVVPQPVEVKDPVVNPLLSSKPENVQKSKTMFQTFFENNLPISKFHDAWDLFYDVISYKNMKLEDCPYLSAMLECFRAGIGGGDKLEKLKNTQLKYQVEYEIITDLEIIYKDWNINPAIFGEKFNLNSFLPRD